VCCLKRRGKRRAATLGLFKESATSSVSGVVGRLRLCLPSCLCLVKGYVLLALDVLSLMYYALGKEMGGREQV